MRFHVGDLPPAPEFIRGRCWRSLGEPRFWTVIAPCAGLFWTALIVFLWLMLTPLVQWLPEFAELRPPGVRDLFVFLLVLLGVMALRELLRVAAHPAAGMSPGSVFGFWPVTLSFFSHYEGDLRRNRFVFILAAPQLAFTILPLVFAVTSQAGGGWLFAFSAMNAIIGYMDLPAAVLVFFRVPACGLIQSRGLWLYWRAPREEWVGTLPAR